MPSDLEKARERARQVIAAHEDWAHGDRRDRPEVQADDVVMLGKLLAATEPVGGELGEAVNYALGGATVLASWFDDSAPKFPITEEELRPIMEGQAAAIRKVCQAVRQLLAEKRLSQGLVGKWVFNEQQAEQPEADPELVEYARRVYTTECLKRHLKNALQQAASYRQALKERGETDGNAG